MNAIDYRNPSAVMLAALAVALCGTVLPATSADAAILSRHFHTAESYSSNDGNPDSDAGDLSFASGLSNNGYWETNGNRNNTSPSRAVRNWGNSSVTDASTAIAQEGANEYAFFAIEPTDSEEVLNLDSISVFRTKFNDAPDRFSIFAYINDDTAPTGRKIVVDDISVPNNNATSVNVDLSSISSFGSTFQGIDKVEFRLIFHGSNLGNSSGGSFVVLDDIVVNGDVVIPEPASLALMGLGTLLMLSRRNKTEET